jgi:hypothetical protein
MHWGCATTRRCYAVVLRNVEERESIETMLCFPVLDGLSESAAGAQCII